MKNAILISNFGQNDVKIQQKPQKLRKTWPMVKFGHFGREKSGREQCCQPGRFIVICTILDF